MISEVGLVLAFFCNSDQTGHQKWEGELALYKFAAEKLS